MIATPYYHPLLINGDIDYSAPYSETNGTLYTQIMTKLNKNYKNIVQSVKTESSTVILQKNYNIYANSLSQTAQINKARTVMTTDNWNLKTRRLDEFVASFATNAQILENSLDRPSGIQLCSYWINLLPWPEFKDLKTALNKHRLEDPWTTALDPMDLLEATNQEIQASGIKITKKVKKPDNPYKRTGQFYKNQAENQNNQNNENQNNRNNDNRNDNRPTDRPERPDRIDNTNRYAFPAEHPNSLQFYKHLKELKEQGKTKDYILSTYKTTYADPGCFICRLKENHPTSMPIQNVDN